MAESKFQTDRRRRIESYRESRPDIKPERTRRALKPGEELSGNAPDVGETPQAPPYSMRQTFEAAGGIPGLVGAGASSLLDTAAEAGRGYAEHVVDPTLRAGSYLLTGQAPPRGAILGMGPNPGKEKARADTRAIAQAAVWAHAAGEGPRGQGPDQKRPAGEGTVPAPKVGTGPGAAAETPRSVTTAGKIGATPTMVKMPDGRIVMGNALDPHRQAGGTNISFQESMATQGLGKPQAERFMRGRTSGPLGDPRPYSAQVRALADAAPETPLDAPGSVAGLGAPGSGGPIQGYGSLSGIEQALARRSWLEGRADAEQRREMGRAEVDRRTRLAEMDPLEMARIQAQGRMGGDLAKVQLDLRAREEARQAFLSISSQIQQLTDRLASASPEEAADTQRYIDYLERTRRELSNLILGERLSDPRAVGDALGLAIAGLGAAGAGAPTTGAR